MPIADSRAGSGAGGTRLRGGRLVVARSVWLVLAALTLGIFIAGVPLHPAHLHTICADVTCGGTQSLASVTAQLRALGLTVAFYAAYVLTIKLVFAGVYFAVAALLFWRRSDDWMALLVALFLMTFAVIYTDVPGVLAQDHVAWWWVVAGVALIGNAAFPLCFYLFPDGRFLPRWTRWLLLVWVAVEVPASFLPTSPYNWDQWTPALAAVLVMAALASIVLTQIYHYRHVSSPAQRQQTKWAVFGVVVGLAGFFGAGLFGSFGPRILTPLFPQARWLTSPAVGIATITLTYLALLLIPLSFAVAILRSRLYDIDRIINRTLVYGALTGVLAVVYGGSVILLQQGFRAFTRQDSAVAVVVSTLAIAALFHPLRRRLQSAIDRRFYRRAYDTARTLEAFGAEMRSAVDLTQLSVDLLAVVRETMQPSHVSLWLRPRERAGSGEAPSPPLAPVIQTSDQQENPATVPHMVRPVAAPVVVGD
jgi:hypothetical protein